MKNPNNGLGLAADMQLRAGIPEDAEVCGRICYEAFKIFADHHNFPTEIPTPEFSVGIVSMMLSNPGFYSVVAECEGEVVGSNYLDERGVIGGVGPITVDPKAWDSGIGRVLMRDVVDRAVTRGMPGVRLNTASHHGRSVTLYSKVGFQVREPLAVMQGPQVRTEIPGTAVRPATESDLEASNRVCTMVHGHDRGAEIQDAIVQSSAFVVERGDRITGYTTGVTFFGHTVGETNDDLKALIAATPEYLGAGFLLPIRNHELFMWCVENGLRIVIPMTHMSLGLYNEPQGAFLPGVLY